MNQEKWKHLLSLKYTWKSTFLRKSLLPVVFPSEWLFQSFLSIISCLGSSGKKTCKSIATECLWDSCPLCLCTIPSRLWPKGHFVCFVGSTQRVSNTVSLILAFPFPSLASDNNPFLLLKARLISVTDSVLPASLSSWLITLKGRQPCPRAETRRGPWKSTFNKLCSSHHKESRKMSSGV